MPHHDKQGVSCSQNAHCFSSAGPKALYKGAGCPYLQFTCRDTEVQVGGQSVGSLSSAASPATEMISTPLKSNIV